VIENRAELDAYYSRREAVAIKVESFKEPAGDLVRSLFSGPGLSVQVRMGGPSADTLELALVKVRLAKLEKSLEEYALIDLPPGVDNSSPYSGYPAMIDRRRFSAGSQSNGVIKSAALISATQSALKGTYFPAKTGKDSPITTASHDWKDRGLSVTTTFQLAIKGNRVLVTNTKIWHRDGLSDIHLLDTESDKKMGMFLCRRVTEVAK